MLPKLLAAAKGVSRDLNNRPYNKEKDYWLLLTSVDVCQLRLLNLKAANVLGHLNEAIADSVLGTQIKSRQRRGLIGKFSVYFTVNMAPTPRAREFPPPSPFARIYSVLSKLRNCLEVNWKFSKTEGSFLLPTLAFAALVYFIYWTTVPSLRMSRKNTLFSMLEGIHQAEQYIHRP
ncbi:hypothetical protein Ndes2526A_g03369 [Nannochloris sp. 'desiccata']